MNEAKPIIRLIGSKYRMAPFIYRKFPPHSIYVEPYGGGGNFLLRKPKSPVEIFNDRDPEIIGTLRTLQADPRALRDRLQGTPYETPLFGSDQVERAAAFIHQQVSGYSGINARALQVVTSGKEEVWSRWHRRVLPAHERLKDVVLTNLDALDVITLYHKVSEALIYCDPPYLGSAHLYRERTNPHALLALLRQSRAKVVLSGNEQFARHLPGWWMDTFTMKTSSSRWKKWQTECVYTNFESAGKRL